MRIGPKFPELLCTSVNNKILGCKEYVNNKNKRDP